MTRRNASHRKAMLVSPQGQRGAALVICLIMLVLITTIVVNAFGLSGSNLKSVGNFQVREEVMAATNQAIEQVLSGAFTTAPASQTIDVDIDKNGTTDYTVAVAAPTCIRALVAAAAGASDVELGASMSSGSTWNTDWEIVATVTDAASGAVVKVHQGVRVLLSDSQKTSVCL